jgi:WD40 repeat protein/response regulator RpfG family c-di-GMP phosphodiesterase
MEISRELINKLLDLLRPFLQDEGERKAYLFRAFGTDTSNRLNLTWKQPTNTFIPELVKELLDFGEISLGQPALCAFLEVIREDVGDDVKVRIDELLEQIQEKLKQPENKYNPNLNWQCIRTIAGHSDTVSSVAISPDGKILASGSLDKTIKLWNLQTGNLIDTLAGHSSAVLSVAFSLDSKMLASSSNLELRDGCIKLWDVEPPRFRQTLGGGLINLRVSSLAFSPDGQALASGHAEAKIRVWNLGSGKLRKTLKGHGWDVNALAFSSDGRFLVSGGLDGAIKIWNWRSGEEMRTLKRPPRSEWIGSLVSWFDSSVGSIWSVAVSPDKKTFASAGSQQPIELWDLETGKLLRILTEHSGTIYSVAFSSDGKILASGGEDNAIKLWNVETGELLQTLEHLGPVKSICFSPNGQTLVSGSADTNIKLWQIHKVSIITSNNSEKLKLLLVDDEPENLDLLYRIFKRDFKVFKSDDGLHALELLEREGEMAVIISDQRMPNMNGTELFSLTVDRFPDTVRILLTGYTDTEPLVDAMNSAHIFKYVTKPWYPEEMKRLVQEAAEIYQIDKRISTKISAIQYGELNKKERLVEVSIKKNNESEKLKLLVVDDEPENLDLLYRIFRRDFKVFQSESGPHALELLEREGEMAVIITDQRMPMMSGAEFLSHTKKRFPDTIRIILTGFTDIEDLVEAINCANVFKYVTKPWNPEELKMVIQESCEIYRMQKKRSNELRRQSLLDGMISTINKQLNEPSD